mgnify:CR=1 FL=1
MRKILSQELERIKISSEEQKQLQELADSVIFQINKKIKKLKLNASVFVGGSLAKQTLMKKPKYDIDLFLRFNKKYSDEEINNLLKKIFRWFKIPGHKVKIKKVHGSRDYYQIFFKSLNAYVEVVPSIKITKPEQARNVTDLSFFHVKFIKKALEKNKKLADEILLAKSFCHGQKCYGAESYIRGFSGYSLEILIAYYKSFARLLREIAKISPPVIIDPAKQYKKSDNIAKLLNKAKIQSPLIVIDPTFKQRNVLSSLSEKSFKKFQEAAQEFLKNPSLSFFEVTPINLESMKIKTQEAEGFFAHFRIKTWKQPGDIAGTKLLKFSKFLTRQIKKQYDVIEKEFEYDDNKTADVYYVLKQKPELIIQGPHLDRKEAVKAFKKAHPIWYIENHIIKSAQPTDILIKDFFKKFKKSQKKTIKEMGIKKVKLV